MSAHTYTRLTRVNRQTMRSNQHRWRSFLDDTMCDLLKAAHSQLSWAWGVDRKSPESFPLNTDFAFAEIRKKIEDHLLGHQPEKEHVRIKLPKWRPPKRLSGLVGESIIKSVYEDQNTGTYQDALKVAAMDHKSATRTFAKILKAVEAAYYINHFGLEAIPRPRIHYLHRNLFLLADLLNLNDLTHAGLAEFLDDLCPCREGHNPEAVRKLRKRRAGSRRTQASQS